MQPMRDFLRGSLARSLRTIPDEDRLAAALPIVCGSALASHCAVACLDEAFTLHLEVRGREWLAPLLGMREVLQHDLARVAGVPLRGLHFQVAGAASPSSFRDASAAAERVLPPTAGNTLADALPRTRNRRYR